MLTLFNNYGPFNGNQTDGSFTLNPDSWHKKYHMIFLDNPVDVGLCSINTFLGYHFLNIFLHHEII